jgi:hypothetical protein
MPAPGEITGDSGACLRGTYDPFRFSVSLHQVADLSIETEREREREKGGGGRWGLTKHTGDRCRGGIKRPFISDVQSATRALWKVLRDFPIQDSLRAQERFQERFHKTF